MSALIINMSKGQRLDLTAQMKDADEVIAAFKELDISFDKKYTSLNSNGPSTITFKGVRAERASADISTLIVDLCNKAQQEKIGNVYLRFATNYIFKKDNKEPVKAKPEEEDPTL